MTSTAKPAAFSIQQQDPLSLPDIPGGAGTIADRLYTILEEAIIDRRLAPGTHLKAETLCRRYGVSMIPVREAIRTLQANGWAVAKPHHGSYVVRGTVDELGDLYEARTVLETAASRLAAQRRSADDLSKLEAAVEQGNELVRLETPSRFAKLNSEFHELIAEATHNGTLMDVQRRLSQRLRFYSSVLPMDRVQRSVEEHAALVEAIKRQDAVAAEAIALEHIGKSKAEVSVQLPTAAAAED